MSASGFQSIQGWSIDCDDSERHNFHVERPYVVLCLFVKFEYFTRTKKFLAQSELVTALQRTCSLTLLNVGRLSGRNVLARDVTLGFEFSPGEISGDA